MIKKFSLFLITTSIVTAGCNSKSGDKRDEASPRAVNGEQSLDTLGDQPQFFISYDGKDFQVPEDKLNVYMGTDSVVIVYAKTGDTAGVQLAIPVKNEMSFSVSTGYSSRNTKIAFSEELAVLPTVILSNYPLVDVSFNNLDDGHHKQSSQPGAIKITGYRVLEGDSLHGWTYQLKGYVNTTVLKTVYTGGDKPYNHDYKLEGKFVVRFKTD